MGNWHGPLADAYDPVFTPGAIKVTLIAVSEIRGGARSAVETAARARDGRRPESRLVVVKYPPGRGQLVIATVCAQRAVGEVFFLGTFER